MRCTRLAPFGLGQAPAALGTIRSPRMPEEAFDGCTAGGTLGVPNDVREARWLEVRRFTWSEGRPIRGADLLAPDVGLWIALLTVE